MRCMCITGAFTQKEVGELANVISKLFHKNDPLRQSIKVIISQEAAKKLVPAIDLVIHKEYVTYDEGTTLRSIAWEISKELII